MICECISPPPPPLQQQACLVVTSPNAPHNLGIFFYESMIWGHPVLVYLYI